MIVFELPGEKAAGLPGSGFKDRGEIISVSRYLPNMPEDGYPVKTWSRR